MRFFSNSLLKKPVPARITATVCALMLLFHTGCIRSNTVGTTGNRVLSRLSDINIFTDEAEFRFGKEYAAQHEAKIKIYTDPLVTRYINSLGQHLVRHSKRSDIAYTFKVVETNGVNAYAIPGGFIYVHLDLIRAARNESELAAVIGHEIGHIVGRHGMKRLTQVYSVEILKELLLSQDAGEFKKFVADALAAGLISRYSRDHERESDFYGVQNVYDAGISPVGAATFFETLHALQRTEPSVLRKFLATHPLPNERALNVRKQISQLPPKSTLRTDSSDFRAVKRLLGQ